MELNVVPRETSGRFTNSCSCMANGLYDRSRVDRNANGKD